MLLGSRSWKRQNKPNGFTLVELSIALVIVGLLIGGVLVGQSLVTSAKLNRIISDNEQYKILISQAISKFKCVPGDCPTTKVGNAAAANNTDNLVIQAYYEQQLVLWHLQLLGIYQGREDLSACETTWPGQAAIECYYRGSDKKSKNIFMVRNFLSSGGGEFNYGPSGISNIETGSNWVAYGGYWNSGVSQATRPLGVLTPTETAAIDSKADDAVATTGYIRTFPGYSYATTDCLTGTNLADPANTYAVTKTNAYCNPHFYLQIAGSVKM